MEERTAPGWIHCCPSGGLNSPRIFWKAGFIQDTLEGWIYPWTFWRDGFTRIFWRDGFTKDILEDLHMDILEGWIHSGYSGGLNSHRDVLETPMAILKR